MSHGAFFTTKSHRLVRFRFTVGTPPRTNELSERAHEDAVGIACSAVEAMLDALAAVHEVIIVHNDVTGPEFQFDTRHVKSFIRYDFALTEGSGRRRVPPDTIRGDSITLIEDSNTIDEERNGN